MEVVNGVSGAPAPVGAYSQAVKHGGLVFLAGQIALDPETGQMIEGGVREQCAQVLKNLDAVLQGAGSSSSKIVMTTIFLAEISDAAVVNELYGQFVNAEAAPARQTVAVKDLPLGAKVEISLIAAE